MMCKSRKLATHPQAPPSRRIEAAGPPLRNFIRTNSDLIPQDAPVHSIKSVGEPPFDADIPITGDPKQAILSHGSSRSLWKGATQSQYEQHQCPPAGRECTRTHITGTAGCAA